MRAREFISESKQVEYKGVHMDVSIDGATVDVRALTKDGRQMAYVVFDRDGKTLVADDLAVEERFRGQGIAAVMYDYVKSLGFKIERSYDQTEMGKAFWDKNRGEERVWESELDNIHSNQKANQQINKTTLNNLYGGSFPDRDELFWDEVRTGDLNSPLTINTMPKHKLQIMLLSQYRVEHLDEILDMMDEDQQEVLQRYMNDPTLSSKVIVISDSRIIDGNHRALAAALKGVPINYVDLIELDEPIDEETIQLASNAKAKEWIQKVYDMYPTMWQNNHVMLWGEGDNQQMAMFELVPSFTKRGAVEVKWFQAYPLRQGVGSRAMKELQQLANQDGISLTLYPWDKGQVSQSKLTKFYKSHGFTPTAKGAKNLQWSPVDSNTQQEVTEAFISPQISTILKAKGYTKVGGGAEQQAYIAPDGYILKIFGTSRRDSPNAGLTRAQKIFKAFADFCLANPDNEFLPHFSDWETFQFKGLPYLQIRMERLFPVDKGLGLILQSIADSVHFGYSRKVCKQNLIDGKLTRFSPAMEKVSSLFGQLITHIGEDGFNELWDTIVKLNKVSKRLGLPNLDLHSGNFMYGSDGHIVISDPFYSGEI